MTRNATAELAELKAAATAAAEAERSAEAEHADTLRAVSLARGALTDAYDAGDAGAVKAAHTALERAQKDAQVSTDARAARAQGMLAARQRAQAAANAFSEAHLAELVEDLRPDAQAAVARVRSGVADLQDALDAYLAVERRVVDITAPVGWFKPYERMPADPFERLRAALDEIAAAEIPEPMPSSTLHPVAEAERVAAVGESLLRAEREGWQPFSRSAAA